MKIVVILIFSIIMISCETTPSKTFFNWYEPWENAYNVNNSIFLGENEEPKIFISTDINEDFYIIRAKYYYCIGKTSFNGPDEDHRNSIKKQCQQNGATLALYSKRYSDTRSGIIGSSGYVSSYTIRRYDYTVYYFVPMKNIPEILKFFGADCYNLTDELRQKTGRNTGAYVNIVYDDSPAFFANIQRNDVIISINDQKINNEDDFYNILLNYNPGETIEVAYIRSNQPFKTNVELK